MSCIVFDECHIKMIFPCLDTVMNININYINSQQDKEGERHNNKNSFDSNNDLKLFFAQLPHFKDCCLSFAGRMMRITGGSKMTPSVLREGHHLRTAHPLVG